VTVESAGRTLVPSKPSHGTFVPGAGDWEVTTNASSPQALERADSGPRFAAMDTICVWAFFENRYARTPRSGPTRCRRCRLRKHHLSAIRGLLLGVAITLVAVTPAQARRLDIRFAPTAAGNARAATAVLRQSDLANLGLGQRIRWKGGRVKADELANSTCPDIPTPMFDATVVGLAKASFDSDDYQLNTQTELFATAPMARAAIHAQTEGAQALACVRDSITSSSTAARVISVARLADPGIGDTSTAFRIEFTEGSGPHHHYVIYLIAAVRGRIQTGVLAITHPKSSASLRAPMIALERTLIARAKT
jgi:hypothetical protein